MSLAGDGAVHLTFAELEYLLDGVAEWQPTRRIFGLQPVTDEGRAAGLSSLAIRGFLTWTGDTAQVDENVRRAAGALSMAAMWLTAVFRTPGGISTSYLGVSSDRSVQVLVSVTAPGCYRLDAVGSGLDPAAQAARLVNDVLSNDLPSMVVLSVGGEDPRRLTIGRDLAGGWFVGSVPPSAAAEDFDAVAQDGAQHALAGYLAGVFGA